jgi:hypothetical protein
MSGETEQSFLSLYFISLDKSPEFSVKRGKKQSEEHWDNRLFPSAPLDQQLLCEYIIFE